MHVDNHRGIDRFIPACAGNAASAMIAKIPLAVHPRVCGERSKAWRTRNNMTGSSPRVRGTLPAKMLRYRGFRFIPACAGNAPTRCTTTSARSVHPRVCGERDDARAAKGGKGGSSPRVRGTLHPPAARRTDQRFIPACAGNAVI